VLPSYHGKEGKERQQFLLRDGKEKEGKKKRGPASRKRVPTWRLREEGKKKGFLPGGGKGKRFYDYHTDKPLTEIFI